MQVFISSLVSIMPIIFLIMIGYGMRLSKKFDESFPRNLAKFVINISLPASIFISVQKYLSRDILFEVSRGLFYTFSSVLLSFLAGYLVSKIIRVRRERVGFFISVFAVSNTLFIGLPITIALYGEGDLSYFWLYYMANTVLTWTLATIIIEGSYKKTKIHIKKLFPIPFRAFLIGIVFMIFEIDLPEVVSSTLNYIGSTVTALSIIYIGMESASSSLKEMRLDRDGVWALVGRFVISPLILYLLVKFGSGIFGEIPDIAYKIFMVQSATAGATVTPLLVADAGGDVKFATSVTAISMLLCIFVVPVVTAII